jgi:hypothetical protein
MASWLDIAEKVLTENGRKPMHVDEIAHYAISNNMVSTRDAEEAKSKLNAALAQGIKSKKPRFRKGKLNGKTKGIYTLKALSNSAISQSSARAEQPETTSNYKGKAGEFAVLSELMFFGFNASIMSVDEGIDIIASKDNAFFHIQVKTSSQYENNLFKYKLYHSRFERFHTGKMYYLFVMRVQDNNGYRNEIAIIPSSKIRDLIAKNVLSITNDGSYAIKISKAAGDYKINNHADITHTINNWDEII